MTTPTAATLRVLVVDDQAPFRIAIRRVLGRASTLDVVAEASDGAEAVQLTEQLHPDIVLLDVRMPGMDGPTAARIIAERWPDISVVLCSSHGREDLPDDLGAPFVAKELLTADVLLAAAGRE
jgi:DNA-binding NarL/FixJ family response regulator